MTYVTEQTSSELRAHMRRLKAMSGWHEPLADRLYAEILEQDAEIKRLRDTPASTASAITDEQIEEGREAIDYLHRHGFRKCDIAACNCRSWHGGDASNRLSEISYALSGVGLGNRGKTLLQEIELLIEEHEAALAAAPTAQPVGQAQRETAIAAAVKAAQEWSTERLPDDWAEAALMKAIHTLNGDWPGCDECDHECDEPCMPATVAEMHASIDHHIADLVHAGKIHPSMDYEPPADWKPTIRIARARTARAAVEPSQPAPAAPSPDAQDAARYRWLRSRPLDWSVEHSRNGWTTCYGRNELDQAIDAALAASTKGAEL